MIDFDSMDESVFETRSTKKSPQKSASSRPKAYRHLDDNQYKRCIIREQLMAVSHNQPADFIEYLQQNKDRILKAGFSVSEMEQVGRSVRFNRRGYNSPWEEAELITSIFGVEKKPVPTYPECQMHKTPERPRTPKQEIEYRKDCTYETFLNWYLGDGIERIMDKFDEDDWDRIEYILPEVMMKDSGLPKQRHYEDGDDRLLKDRLAELKRLMEEKA